MDSISNYSKQSESSKGGKQKRMNRQDREMYKQAIKMEGKLYKKSSNVLIGWQQRYFKVIANGQFLVYYEKASN